MRRAVALAAAFAALGCDVILGPDPSASNASMFDLVWNDLDRHYAYFELKQVDWQQKRDLYRPQALAATGPAQWAQVIATMLSDLKDVHVNLYAGYTTYRYTGNDTLPYYFNANVVFKAPYVSSSAMTPSTNMRHGMIGTSTLLYVWIPSLSGSGWSGEMDAVLAAHPAATGIILDIRNNGGGSNLTGRELSGRFTDIRRLYAWYRMRSGPSHGDFTGFGPVYLNRMGSRHFDGPVVVLTSRRNYSAAEEFVLGMQQLPQVTVVGDTTGGGLGSPVYRELPNGWTYRFSEGMTYDVNRVLHEMTGIAPSVFIRESSLSFQSGIDDVLEKGCEVLGVPKCGRA